jgi:hypothetical protein
LYLCLLVFEIALGTSPYTTIVQDAAVVCGGMMIEGFVGFEEGGSVVGVVDVGGVVITTPLSTPFSVPISISISVHCNGSG